MRKEADILLQVGDEVKEIEGDPLTMALDRRKHRSSGQVRRRSHIVGFSQQKKLINRRTASEES